jgi:hypothetical protein
LEKLQLARAAGNGCSPPLGGVARMKAYLWTTAVIFGSITVAHVARIVMESHELARDPWFLLLSLLAAGMCGWALRLLHRLRTP